MIQFSYPPTFLYLNCLVGIGWNKTQIREFEMGELELDRLVINLQLTVNPEDLYTIDLVEERKKPAVGFYLMMMMIPVTPDWETFPCQMTFEHISHSWINTPTLDQMNNDFSQALEAQVTSVYKKSFVFKYFNVEVRSENGIVHFYNLSKRQVMKSDRFNVLLKIPDNSKPFFKGVPFWDTTFGPEWPEWVLAQKLSQFSNGTLTHNSPGTKSHLYTPPFSISFRSQGIEGNFLSFNRFNSPNLEDSILTMLLYDNATNTFLPFFDPYLIIPYQDHITLTQDLEFKILDSNKRHVHISDNSQLFFVLTLM